MNVERIRKNEESELDQNIKVLMYHRVLWEKPEDHTKWHYVTATEFENHMKWLERLGYTAITFSDYELYKKDELSLPKKPIIITFDDGYQDTFENAIPIMLKYNMRAVIFVMGNRSLKHAKWDQQDGENPCLLMTDDQIRMADSLGFEIGAHSMNHIDLRKAGLEEIEREVIWSKYQIEQILGDRILSFAYPYGSVNKKAQQIVFKSGFKYACGVFTGPARFGKNRFDIRRIAINAKTTGLQYLLRILTPFEYAEWSYAKLKGITHSPDIDQDRLPVPNGNSHETPEAVNRNSKVVLN